MFFAKIPRHIRQNAITEGDLECILTRNCEGTEQLPKSNGSAGNDPGTGLNACKITGRE